MTLNEFRAWLDGYSASFKDGCPDADQWARICAKLADVAGVSPMLPDVLGPAPTTWKLTNNTPAFDNNLLSDFLVGVGTCARPV